MLRYTFGSALSLNYTIQSAFPLDLNTPIRHRVMHRRRLPVSLPFIAAFLLGASLPRTTGAQEESPELAQAQAQYRRDMEFSTKPIRDRYLSRLDSLKRQLGARGDARGAIAVQEEMDRVKDVGGGLDRFAGVWSVKYPNGTVRTYSITAEGILRMTEENGVRITPRIAKIMIKGSDFLVESAEGTIERLTLAGNKLMVDHYNPKTTYPAGAPALRASGVRTAAAKP